jgi:DNA-binding NarL/FixJ family response regulator
MALLTAREQEIARLVAQGLNQRQIAERLCISPATVKTHVDSARCKTGSPRMIDLAVKVATNQ